ncbi:hypothetical protein C1701_26780 [Actinoalloteichus sp. AHMU CJ021]|nr:hypothetical protein C1701_26780 [Actinoalloteichus sp. AHMU CJ021]
MGLSGEACRWPGAAALDGDIGVVGTRRGTPARAESRRVRVPPPEVVAGHQSGTWDREAAAG